LFIGAVVASSLSPALAEDGVQDGKTYRLVLTNGKQMVGEVTELEEAYRVTVSSGITVTLKKSQVRELTLADAPAGPDGSPRRRPISDEEIAEILGSELIEDLGVWEHFEEIDLMQPLPTDAENLELMKRIAGRQARVYETDHFVLAYTSSDEKARRMAARFEAVYKWRVWFLEKMGVKPVRPEHKFEMFFFGTLAEFQAYQGLHGNIAPGVLGFWSPTDNRSAFFDCDYFPPIAAAHQRYSDPDVDARIRRRGRNLVKRWVEDFNMEVVQHEAGHHIDFNIGFFPQWGDVPRWLPEGLTQMFEVPPSRMGAAFGKVNYRRLNELRQIYGQQLENLPPMRDFMLRNEIWFQGYNYPRGWALVHYLINRFPDEFARFLQLIAQREDERGVVVPLTEKLDQIEELFGEIDDEWTQRFKDYMNDIPMRISELPPEIADFP
jgi:hypothetical protein